MEDQDNIEEVLLASGPALVPVGAHAGRPATPLHRMTVIGSHELAHLRLVSPLVSRAHAVVLNCDGAVFLHDLNSREGTTLNGRPVAEAELKEGDVVGVGPFSLRLAMNDGPHQHRVVRRPRTMRLELPEGEPMPLDRRVLVIGSREGCDLRLEDPMVATVHAAILQANGRHYVRDLGSHNGTLVNGRPVKHAKLRPGDTIRIGRHLLHYARLNGQAVEAMAIEPDSVAGLPLTALDPLEDLDTVPPVPPPADSAVTTPADSVGESTGGTPLETEDALRDPPPAVDAEEPAAWEPIMLVGEAPTGLLMPDEAEWAGAPGALGEPEVVTGVPIGAEVVPDDVVELPGLAEVALATERPPESPPEPETITVVGTVSAGLVENGQWMPPPAMGEPELVVGTPEHRDVDAVVELPELAELALADDATDAPRAEPRIDLLVGTAPMDLAGGGDEWAGPAQRLEGPELVLGPRASACVNAGGVLELPELAEMADVVMPAEPAIDETPAATANAPDAPAMPSAAVPPPARDVSTGESTTVGSAAGALTGGTGRADSAGEGTGGTAAPSPVLAHSPTLNRFTEADLPPVSKLIAQAFTTRPMARRADAPPPPADGVAVTDSIAGARGRKSWRVPVMLGLAGLVVAAAAVVWLLLKDRILGG